MSKTTLEKFGEKIRKERLKQGLSQEELASKTSVHRTYIGMIERAEKNITLENIEKIARALDLPINELFMYGPNSSK
ncbi:MAG: helix-turn-helix transcriptional regulator [Parcubacteria group bacterium]|nr:helix-turn-helix transcriptional regulator [Parcubacteria group bacterium]